MNSYLVTVTTQTTFEVESLNPQEAKKTAIKRAETTGGDYFDWEVKEISQWAGDDNG